MSEALKAAGLHRHSPAAWSVLGGRTDARPDGPRTAVHTDEQTDGNHHRLI